MGNADRLALWVRHSVAGPVTHLKLQKLVFYCYGAVLAFDLEQEVGDDVRFEAWEHGPVCRTVWETYRTHGGNPIERPQGTPPSYSPRVEEVLADVLAVYGGLAPWALRQQSHLEEPWKATYAARTPGIDPATLKAYFKQRLTTGKVRAPEYLLQSWSLAVDGIPEPTYPSLDALARIVRRSG